MPNFTGVNAMPLFQHGLVRVERATALAPRAVALVASSSSVSSAITLS
jgi:hypothetical protein